jgi:hypothetical protein
VEDLALKLVNYGALGILSLVLLLGCVHLFRTLTTAREKHMAEIKELNATHRAEMTIMIDRYIATANTQVQQYHQLAEKMNAVLDAFSRKLDYR